MIGAADAVTTTAAGSAASSSAEPAAVEAGGAMRHVVDATELRVLNVEVVVCGAKHPSLASPPHRRDADSAEESEARLHLRNLGWKRAQCSNPSVGGLLPSTHELRCDLDVRVDGFLFFRTDLCLAADIAMQADFALRSLDINMPEGLTLTVWPRQIALLNKWMGWLSHAWCVIKYASQRCGPKQPVRPRIVQDGGHILDRVGDGVVVVETRHRAESEIVSMDGGGENISPKELTYAELDEAHREAALRLGCGSPGAWDNGEATVWLKKWPELTTTEKRAAHELGLDEWNWDDDDDSASSRQSLSSLSIKDKDTRLAVLQSMEIELKRINARRLWEYARRCIRLEQAQRAPHNLFRLRVLKNRAETKYVALYRKLHALEAEPQATEASGQMKQLRDEINEIEEASFSFHAFAAEGASGFWASQSPLLSYAEIVHCRKVARMSKDSASCIPFDAAPPLYPAATAAGPALKARLRELKLVLTCPATNTSETRGVSFVMDTISFSQHASEETTHLNVEVNSMSLSVETAAPGEEPRSFAFVTTSVDKGDRGADMPFLKVDMAVQLLLTKIVSRISCLTCYSDLRPLNWLNEEMAAHAPARVEALYAPLLDEITDANDAVKFEDDITELQRSKWTEAFHRLSSGEPDEGASFSADEAADMACKLIVESVGASAQEQYDAIRGDKPGHRVDWEHLEQFAERVGYMRHDHLRKQKPPSSYHSVSFRPPCHVVEDLTCRSQKLRWNEL
jgi:hypothetical protein